MCETKKDVCHEKVAHPSQDSEDNWVWQAEVEPGQGTDSGVYGLQVGRDNNLF